MYTTDFERSLLQFKTIFYLFFFNPVIVKLNFQHHNSSLQCHMILQKSFWYADLLLKKHYLLLSILKTVVWFNIFV